MLKETKIVKYFTTNIFFKNLTGLSIAADNDYYGEISQKLKNLVI